MADTEMSKIGRGPDSGMEHTLMKSELEVVVDPKGTTTNLSITQPSLEPRGEQTEPWSLDLTTQIKEIRSEQS